MPENDLFSEAPRCEGQIRGRSGLRLPIKGPGPTRFLEKPTRFFYDLRNLNPDCMIRASYMPGKSIIWHSYKPAESGTGASVCGSGNTPVLGDPAKTSREVMCEGKIRAIYELRLGNFPDSGARFSEDILSSRVSCFQHSTSKNGAMFMQFRGICRREGGARYSQVWTDDQDWDRAELRSPGKRSVLQTIKFSE